jgi:hypothetical protein
MKHYLQRKHKNGATQILLKHTTIVYNHTCIKFALISDDFINKYYEY